MILHALALVALLPAQNPPTPAPNASAPQAPTPAPNAPPAQSAGPRDVSNLILSIREKHDVPALCVAALRGGELISRGVVGVRKRGSPEKAGIDDQWHLGSCTKAMTATLAAILVEEGKLKWNTGIFELYPELVAMSAPGWKDETLSALLLNRGGLPAELDADDLWQHLWDSKGTPVEQRRMLLEGVLMHPPLSAPGSTFLYANANFAVAGALLERAGQKPWEELMQEKLFAPLGMRSAGFGPPGSASALDQPRGHDEKGNPVGLTGNADNPAAISPAGRVHASISDWAKFVALHLEGARIVRGLAPNAKPRLLSKESLELLQASPLGPDTGYAMGWNLTKRPWGSVLVHSGSNNLWYCMVMIVPEKDFAALACCNQGGKEAEKACDEAIGAIMQQSLGPLMKPNTAPAPK